MLRNEKINVQFYLYLDAKKKEREPAGESIVPKKMEGKKVFFFI